MWAACAPRWTRARLLRGGGGDWCLRSSSRGRMTGWLKGCCARRIYGTYGYRNDRNEGPDAAGVRHGRHAESGQGSVQGMEESGQRVVHLVRGGRRGLGEGGGGSGRLGGAHGGRIG